MKNIILKTLMLILCSSSVYGEVHGKLDLGGVLMDIDILESGKTIETLHMTGTKGDATVLVYEGITVKGGFLYGWGDGELRSGTVAAGYYLPLGCFHPMCEGFSILPTVGITFTYLSTRVDLNPDIPELQDLKERFRSDSPFIGFDFGYTFNEKWSIMGTYQYGWSRTHTKIKPFVSSKSHSDGPNYNLGIEYNFDEHWVINFGLGYNIMLSHEKHGLRGKGAKLGVAYYF